MWSGYGGVCAPVPIAFCISTLSSQRPNLKPTDRRSADHAEAHGAMQLDRGRLRRVADHRDHLAELARLRFNDQPVEQRAADAAALHVGAM